MCGIIGVFNLDEDPTIPVDPVRRGMQRMALRGPDDEGLYTAPGIALGHRRLAIIDVSGGHQPWVDAATGTVLVFNGEIYNFRELREQLARYGHCFRTASDTEVLLHAYLQWNIQCLAYLSGMFAFGIFNPRQQTLFLARDRLGIKPLFFAQQGQRLMFASSMSALLSFPDIEKSVDEDACSHYLMTLRTTMGSRTLLKEVKTLQPGEYLLAHRGQQDLAIRRYWDIPALAPSDKNDPGLETAAQHIRNLLTQSVREQLISDVPLGGFLSGGIDSSVLASLANQLSSGHFDAYSVGYDLEGYHEWPYVRAATTFHHMTCQEIHLEPAAYPAVWKFLIEQNGLPLSTPNEVPIYHLARALKQDFTVALSGEGADEVFGGYVVPYFSAYDYDRARRSPPEAGELLTPMDRALRRLYRRPYLLCPADHYFLLNSWISFAQKQSLFTKEAWRRLNEDDAVCGFYESLLDRFADCSTFDKYMQVHARVNLEGLLFREDSSTMAASVEARVPYTDHRLVEYLFSLPDHYKMNWTNEAAAERSKTLNVREIDRENLVESKILLRRVFGQQVPPEILGRRKMSFPVPVREWFGGFLKATAEEAVRSSALIGTLFEPSAMQGLLDTAHLPPSGLALWPVANLCLWQMNTGVHLS